MAKPVNSGGGSSPITTKVTVNNKITNAAAANYTYNIIVFQENGNRSVAYYVIQNLANNLSNDFNFNQAVGLSIQDAWGNYSQPIPVKAGQQYEFKTKASKNVLENTNQTAASPTTLEVINGLSRGSLKANIFHGKSMAISSGTVVPGQKAIISINNTIWLGVDNSKSIRKGDLLNAAFVQEITANVKNQFKLDNLTTLSIDFTAPSTGFTFAKSAGGS